MPPPQPGRERGTPGRALGSTRIRLQLGFVAEQTLCPPGATGGGQRACPQVKYKTGQGA